METYHPSSWRPHQLDFRCRDWSIGDPLLCASQRQLLPNCQFLRYTCSGRASAHFAPLISRGDFFARHTNQSHPLGFTQAQTYQVHVPSEPSVFLGLSAEHRRPSHDIYVTRSFTSLPGYACEVTNPQASATAALQTAARARKHVCSHIGKTLLNMERPVT